VANQQKARVHRGGKQPSWGYLIVLGLVAIYLVNLLAATCVLLFNPTPERHWFLGVVWAITVLGLTRLPKVRRAIEARQAAPPRRPSA
jgi:hypothetical protein